MPSAAVPEAEYDFGVMDPLAEGNHIFTIRNQGGGPLTLALGQSSGASIRGQVVPATVAPGQSAEVRVTWTTGVARPDYFGGVLVETNDRSNSGIRLTIRGRVRVQVGADPERLAVAEVPPGEDVKVSAVVYSQVWPDLRLAKTSCSIPGAVCRVEPADSAALSRLQAATGCTVTVMLPRDMPSGPFAGVVRIEAQNAAVGSPPQVMLELPISGRVLRRLAVYGDGVQDDGVVDLGIHPPGKGWRHRLLLKVRDPEADLRLARVQTQPDFVRVSLAPYGTESGTQLYHLDLSVPADAPECVYRGTHLGELKLVFDHPRIKDLTLRLALAVMPRR
jgi:hypothetical protein